MVNILIGVSFCVAIGGLVIFTLSIYFFEAKQSATGAVRKKKEEQAMQLEAVGKLLGIIGAVGLIASAVINKFLIS